LFVNGSEILIAVNVKFADIRDVTTCNLVERYHNFDCLGGLVVRVLGYRSGGPGSIPGTTRKKR
jgi:hypothetical protein